MWIIIIIFFFFLHFILQRVLTIKSMLGVAIMLKRLTVKDVAMNNYELLNILACSGHVLEQGCAANL